MTEEDRFRRQLKKQGKRSEDIDQAWREYLEEEGVRHYAEKAAQKEGKQQEEIEAAAEARVRAFRRERDGL